MKFRQICAAALAAVVLVSGCSKPGTESVDKYTRDGEGRVIPISDEYIPANYTPRSDDWSVMLREIPGSFGQETDKLIPAVYLTTSTPSAIIKEEYADCTVQRSPTKSSLTTKRHCLECPRRSAGCSSRITPTNPC